ncbi:uracil-xanthine permease family protein [Adhaeretor mobilis]|uniref:Uric acid transporter UacT n=1 Tax=Adhaeretor mobilis TaxID=1930276 RepID=A0A517N1J2_9BACT|nr:solute carrier family 23 protein [Adhaeretor mobilis]QDT00878.1 Uric acid transporter UacT [Adhaeretor mobilis]
MLERTIIYGLDDKPPFARSVVLGLQHVLTMFGSTVAVPLIFGPVLWPMPEGLSAELTTQLTEMQLTNTALLISSVMLCSGVATLLQSTFGSRLPIIQGVSFSFLAAFFAIIADVHQQAGLDWSSVAAGSASDEDITAIVDQWQAAGSSGMQTIAGAIIFGGILEAIVGFTGLMGYVRRMLSPVVIGPVIMLIGLALYQFGAPVAATHWPISLLTMFLIVLFSLVLSKQVRFFQLFPMLSAIGISVSVCAVLTSQGIFQPGNAAYIDTSAVSRSDWFRTTTVFFPWGFPKLATSAVVAVLAGYLASMIESFGDYHACKNMAGGGDPTPKEISRGIGFEGVGCSLTGVLGGFSSTSYSENIGLVGLTKVGSRYVVQIGAVVLILLGLFGKFGALASAIPKPVVGGLYCALFGLIAAVGVRQFAKADLNSDRNLFIGGFALFMGLSVPFYFDFGTGKADLAWLANVGGSGEDGGANAFGNGLYGVAIAIGSTGMAVAAILGILLDNLVPGTKEERGLSDTGPGILVPEAGDVDIEPTN